MWFNGAAPEKADGVRRAVCGTMANNVFIASAAGSGKTLSVILPLALEGFAGLDFVALFVVPTTRLLARPIACFSASFMACRLSRCSR